MRHAILLVLSIVVLAMLGIVVLAFAGLGQPFAVVLGTIGTGALVALFKYWPFGRS